MFTSTIVATASRILSRYTDCTEVQNTSGQVSHNRWEWWAKHRGSWAHAPQEISHYFWLLLRLQIWLQIWKIAWRSQNVSNS